ncbi:MAG: ROK family protein [Elusimicrobium sp.]|jgi:glucokinase|nr:ROK family protein [Elusimicrobium sp.]
MRNVSYNNDIRTVLTLDAGGTNLVFSAVRSNKEITEPVTLPTHADNLDKCLANIVAGFETVIKNCKNKPTAISFAFPGPADYVNGVIGDLPNLPAFRGGVALGPYLKEKFAVPVFINNDGDLFAYGEAFAGVLPDINAHFAKIGSHMRYNNLFGITLGTGSGGGIVRNGELFLGDNGASAEIWVIRNKKYPECFSEEGVSIRAVKRSYRLLSGDKTEYTPKDIFEIAEGTKKGDAGAAKAAFAELGDIAGNQIANVSTVVDGIVVIGGGLAAAHKYFMPALIAEMNGKIACYDGRGTVDRMESKAYNLEDPRDAERFYKGGSVLVKIPGSNKEAVYNKDKKIGVAVSKLGTSKAVSIGAYSFALNEIDKTGAAKK